ncbi:hypothetical protein BT96DRAFT_806790 [Gymnopus androsaceus JB14]|uniref:Uncharacterized protein n=1 Tax=Gymnopus androsaceus JB14 TaxID=1447944 RepID=A0A6A4IIT0_9AGAR|nr:hypothetical protein BT96DRAFT_806790 [Gymnopus androsaceus JB14]
MSESQATGFPPGYFIIRSVATGRVFDVAGNFSDDGTDIILWPEKETSIVDPRRNPEANNQVFFIDTSGALCSRGSGHCIDVEDSRLTLRHRRPISLPFPNSYSHPLPTFTYSPKTSEIHVNFLCDPSYPPPSDAASVAWKHRSYVLTSIPLRKPKTFIDDASQFITSNLSTPLVSFFGTSADTNATPEEVASVGIDLAEDEVLEEDRGDEAEVDDSPDPKREVCVIISNEQRKGDLVEKAKRRRQWDIIPLRTVNKRTAGI